MLIEEQYKKLFGEKIVKYEVMKDMTASPETAYFTSKTQSIGRRLRGVLNRYPLGCVRGGSGVCGV